MPSPDPDNPNPENQPPVVVVVGPTAVGKTEIAIQLAEKLHGEIVSADSRTFYRGMDIGTAKPTQEEQKRVPHHLVDIADPDDTISLALFQRRAHQAISEIHARENLPFLVGGTGQYIRAFLEGWEIPPAKPDERLRIALEDWAREIGPEGLHARLAVLDPEAASQIDFRNLRRTIRALEVIVTTGMPFSRQRQQKPSPYRLFILGLNRPREELYARIDARVEFMIEKGFIEEVRSLLERGYSPELPGMSAIGYKQIADYLLGKISLEEAVMLMKRTTRVFVRRQANWFKTGDPGITWFQVEPGVMEKMVAAIQAWLGAWG